jgi:uncharacterized protein YndB with AHSA1/START domain
MPVKKDASGCRSVEMEFELPGTPEQVWRAIATGSGISSWLFPTEVEEREGGAVAFHIGPGMESSGHVTVWQPPQRFAYEEPGWSGDAAPLATEFIIEAQAGGTCKVRLVHSLFASDDAWDDQLDGMENGWPAFFNVLRLYLSHFPGQRSAAFRLMGPYQGSMNEAWDALLRALRLSGVAVGECRDASIMGGPSLAGRVERVEQLPHQKVLTLLLDTPSSGVALIGVFTWEKQVQVSIGLYFYGDDAGAVAAQERPRWDMWLEHHFPSASAEATSAS